MSKKIRFGIMLQGAGGHMNSWRHPKSPVGASVNLDFFKTAALKAEAAGIAFAFVADGSTSTKSRYRISSTASSR